MLPWQRDVTTSIYLHNKKVKFPAMGKAFSLIDQSGRITVGCKPAANFGTFVPTIIPCLARFSEV